MDFSPLLPLLQNPVVVGAFIATALKTVQKLFEKVDQDKLLAPFEKHLKLIYIVTTFLASAAQLALAGHLSQVDINAAVNFLITYFSSYVGGKAMGALPVKPAEPKDGNK